MNKEDAVANEQEDRELEESIVDTSDWTFAAGSADALDLSPEERRFLVPKKTKKVTNWRALQYAGSLAMKPVNAPHPTPPRDIKPKHLAMGSWKANLSKGALKTK